MRPLLASLLDVIAPRRCPGCDEPSNNWCARCGVPAPICASATLDGVPLLAAGEYDGALASAIRRFKYASRSDLAQPLAELVLSRLEAPAWPSGALWVPVPLHARRVVERGFNQSALIAAQLARASRLPCAPRLLARVRDTPQQAELDRAARAANIRGAFTLRGKAPRSALLVDDVVTTGATARACIEALRKHGVAVVAVFALARTPEHREDRGRSLSSRAEPDSEIVPARRSPCSAALRGPKNRR